MGITWDQLNPLEQELLADASDDSYLLPEAWSTVSAHRPALPESDVALEASRTLTRMLHQGLLELRVADDRGDESPLPTNAAEGILGDTSNYLWANIERVEHWRYGATSSGHAISRLP